MITTQQQKIIESALSYVKDFKGSSILIKLGGSILDDPDLVKQLCDDLSLLRAAGIAIVIVHGGGKAINKALTTYQMPSTFIDGLRITTKDMMDIIEMVLSGHVNKMLVRMLNAANVNALGFSGADNKLLQCSYLNKQLGFVGNIEAINNSLIHTLLATQSNTDTGIIPVISPVGIDAHGQALNINADWAASHLACSLQFKKLIYLTDEPGIYDSNKNILSTLSINQLQALIEEKTVSGGMLIKVKTIIHALKNGIEHVHIINGKQKNTLISELFTKQGIGTICTE